MDGHIIQIIIIIQHEVHLETLKVEEMQNVPWLAQNFRSDIQEG
jgi:hypothetical protein